MELRQLQHFLAVAEEQHFTRAAQRVNIVQSALSASIRALEQELGAPLFVRSTRQVRLTEAGRVLSDRASALLNAVDEMRCAVAEVQGLYRGRLAIGTVHSLPQFLDLPTLMSRFHAAHPAIEIRLCQGSAVRLMEKIRDGRLDLAVLPLHDPPPGIATRMIACESLVVACAADHPLAGRQDVPLAELCRETFVDFEADWGTRRLVDGMFGPIGQSRRIGFEVNDLDTLLDLVARGLGIAVVPEAIAAARQPALGVAHPAGPEICWELVVAYPAGGTGDTPADPAPRAFLDLLPSWTC